MRFCSRSILNEFIESDVDLLKVIPQILSLLKRLIADVTYVSTLLIGVGRSMTDFCVHISSLCRRKLGWTPRALESSLGTMSHGVQFQTADGLEKYSTLLADV